MPETLLTPSGIKLYGRVVKGVALVHSLPAAIVKALKDRAKKSADSKKKQGAAADEVTVTAAQIKTALEDLGFAAPDYGTLSHSHNRFLEEQLSADDARLARIYAFSFEGNNYDLPRPAIFLVHGEGTPVELPPPADRSTTDTSGVVARDWEFAAPGPDGPDLRMWEYDKGDFSLRLDVDTGPLDQVLLAHALRGGGAGMSGAHLGLSGAHLGVSGAHLGVSGAHLGISGAHLGRRR